MNDRLDMSMMFAMHDALRRELAQVGPIARLRDDHPGALLRAALGWELFKKFLVVHHQAEDDTLWPALRARVAGRPERLALADALEAEHAVIEPLLTAIDAAAADQGYGYQRFGDIVDELATKLTAHLAHEESDGLPLIDASLTPQEWQNFAQNHTERLRGDAATYMPWLLNGASPQTLDAVLGKFPPPLLTAFRQEWSPRYAALDIWPAAGKAPAAGCGLWFACYPEHFRWPAASPVGRVRLGVAAAHSGIGPRLDEVVDGEPGTAQGRDPAAVGQLVSSCAVFLGDGAQAEIVVLEPWCHLVGVVVIAGRESRAGDAEYQAAGAAQDARLPRPPGGEAPSSARRDRRTPGRATAIWASFCGRTLGTWTVPCALTPVAIASPGISRRSSGAASLARHGSSMKVREGGNGEDQACSVDSPVA